MAKTPSPRSPVVIAHDGDLYGPWLRLRLSHGFLASAADISRHLLLQPCAATVQTLRRLEMVVHQDADGCSLLVKGRMRSALARWLEASGGGPLQWRLVARQGSIWGCTAVPLGARCRQWHLYGAAAKGQSEGELAVRLLAVEERALMVTPPKTARFLRLLDDRGDPLREIPLTPADAAQSQAARSQVVRLDGLPEGLIQPSFGGKRSADAFLHLAFAPDSIGLVSLRLPAAAAATGPLDFSFSLPGRRTIWHYLLVTREAGEGLESLRIEGDGCAFTLAPAPETLADGRRAWRMVGDRVLPLLERSPLRFRLEGQRLDGEGQSHRLMVDPLPVAAAEHVWPGDGSDPLVGVSEMVVPL
jgi:hypothetical protein